MIVGELLLAFVIPLGILAHELGHACVALWLSKGPVRVLVGRQPGMLRLKIGRLSLSLHVEPARGTGWAGLCLWEPTGRGLHSVLITAAGPIASLSWAVACTLGLVAYGHRLGALGQIALILGGVQGTCEFVYNGAAAAINTLVAARPRSDGARLRAHWRVYRAQRSLEAEIGRALTDTEYRHIVRERRLPPDVQRARTSIPPPARQS